MPTLPTTRCKCHRRCSRHGHTWVAVGTVHIHTPAAAVHIHHHIRNPEAVRIVVVAVVDRRIRDSGRRIDIGSGSGRIDFDIGSGSGCRSWAGVFGSRPSSAVAEGTKGVVRICRPWLAFVQRDARIAIAVFVWRDDQVKMATAQRPSFVPQLFKIEIPSCLKTFAG